MVKGTGAHYVQAGINGLLIAGKVGRALARRIRAVRPQQTTLVLRLVRPVGVAVDEAAAGEEDARPTAPTGRRLIQCARGRQVAGPRHVWFIERLTDLGVTGEMVDLLR